MAVLIDTATVPPADRFALWADASWNLLSALRIRPGSEAPFQGSLRGYRLGLVQLFRIAGDASTALRTRKGIATRDPEYLELCLVRRGRCMVVQDGRSALATPGDLVGTDTSRPYVFQALTPFELIGVQVPKALLGAQQERICARTALPIPADDGLAGLVGPFVSQLADRLDRGLVPEGDASLGESLTDLARGLYRDRVDSGGAARRRSSAELLLRAKAFIAAHLGDPALGPERIARAVFVSTRYLHRLFEEEGTTVCGWIRAERLERCRRELADASLAHEPVVGVATRWGFASPAHFSRVFREAYGCSPRELRARALAARGPKADAAPVPVRSW